MLTTAAVLATSRGQFALAIAFGLILLAHRLHREPRRHPRPATPSARERRGSAAVTCGSPPVAANCCASTTWTSPPGRRWPCSARTGPGKSTLLRALGLLSRHRVTGEVLLDGTRPRRAQLRDRGRGRTATADPAPGHGGRQRRQSACGSAGCAGPRARRSAAVAGRARDRAPRRPATPARSPAARPSGWPSPERSPSAPGAAARRAVHRAGRHHPRRPGRRSALGPRPARHGHRARHPRPHEAAALAHDTALLIRGRIRQHGPTAEVLDRPPTSTAPAWSATPPASRPSSPAATCFLSPDPNAAGSCRPGRRLPAPRSSSRARCAGSSHWGEPRGSTSTPQRDRSPS